MAQAQNKTSKTAANVDTFLNTVPDETRRRDSRKVCQIMQEVTGQKPAMWGPSIIGFGSYHYKYESGREGDFLKIGFSPRKNNLSIYFMDGVETYKTELQKLGKHKTAKSCLYINKLDDVDVSVLKEMVKKSYANKAMGEV